LAPKHFSSCRCKTALGLELANFDWVKNSSNRALAAPSSAHDGIRGGIVVFKDSIQGSTGDVEAWLPKLFLLLTDTSPLFSPTFPFPPILPPSLSKTESDPGYPVVWKLFRVISLPPDSSPPSPSTGLLWCGTRRPQRVKASSSTAANDIAYKVTAEKLNAKLKAAGLPEAEMLKFPSPIAANFLTARLLVL
jgi:hypothetical protein